MGRISEILNSNISNMEKHKLLTKYSRKLSVSRKVGNFLTKWTIAEEIMNELHFTKEMREEVKHMLKYDFRKLKSISYYSMETVICIICFFIMCEYRKDIRLDKYKVFKEYDVTENKVNNVYRRMISFYRSKVPIRLKETFKDVGEWADDN